MAEPGSRVVGIRQDRGSGRGEDRRRLVVDVEGGTRCEPAALGEDQVGCYLQEPLLLRALHLGEKGTQAVYQGEGYTCQDVEVLVVEA